jgi:hypothetical protein
MTLQETIQAKQAQLKAQDTTAEAALISNVPYIEFLATIANETELTTALDTVIDRMNQMKAIVTNDGTKYGVNCYPLPERIFGSVMSRVLGIVSASSACFTTERQTELTALTHVSYPIWTAAANALGKPAYFNKTHLVPEYTYAMQELQLALTAICQGLNIPITYVVQVTPDKLDKWFLNSEIKANEKLADFQRTELLDSTNQFTLEA